MTYDEISAACYEAAKRLAAAGAPRNIVDRFTVAGNTVPVLQELEERKGQRAST